MLNYKKYDEAVKQLYARMRAEQEKNDGISDNELWELAENETAAYYMPLIHALEQTRSAISEASQPRNDWFKGFCKSLRNGQKLTDKQFDCFARYAKADQYTRYKTPVTTFRTIIDGALYTVNSILKIVRIEQLTLIE